MDNDVKVGCETTDGLLNVHPASETCEVCSDPSVEGEVPKVEKAPKHKHYFAPGYDFCDCGAARCSFTISARRSCKTVATKSGLCRRHQKEADAAAEGKRGFWTIDRIEDILINSDKTTTLEGGKVVKNSLIIYRFLQRMFERQTQDEQQSFATSHDNGIGFAGCDARLLSDIATGSLKFNTDYRAKYGRVNPDGLTVRQAKYVASRLKKYVKTQLVEIANEATADASAMPEVITARSIEDLRRLNTPEPVDPANFRSEREAAMGAEVREALAPAPTKTWEQGVQEKNIEAKVAGMKLMDPAKYYDPFDEGERLSDADAEKFWTKRFGGQQ